MKEISDKLYHQLKRLGIIDADTRLHNVGASDYSKHIIQPWSIWIEYNLNAFDADILKRVLRTKEGEDRITDYEKIIHICQERIRQLKCEKESIPAESVREEDGKIHKGDVFECIQEVCKNNIRFRKGETYKAYIANHIANEKVQNCYFEPYEWEVFFKRI